MSHPEKTVKYFLTHIVEKTVSVISIIYVETIFLAGALDNPLATLDQTANVCVRGACIRS